MDERKFREVLEEFSKTADEFGEEVIFTALSIVAERFGWELLKRDPGPEDEREDISSGEVWPEDPKGTLTEADRRLLAAAFPASNVIDMTGKLR